MKRSVIFNVLIVIVLLANAQLLADDSILTVSGNSSTSCSLPAIGNHTLTWSDWVAGGAPGNWEVTVQISVAGTLPSRTAFYVRVYKNGSVVHQDHYGAVGTDFVYLPANIGDNIEVRICLDIITGVSSPSEPLSVATCTVKLFP